MSETTDNIDESLAELRSYMETLESIKMALNNNPGVDLDVNRVKQSVEDFSSSVTDLIYAMQQKTDYKIKIRIEA